MKYCVCIQGQISFVLCGVHPLPILRLLCEGSSVSSWLFLMTFAYWLRVSYEGTCVPKPSFNDVQNSTALLPNKTWNTVNVLTSICKNLPQSMDKQQLTSKRSTIVTAPIVSLMPYPWFEFSHVKHCTVPPLYTKLLKWPTQLTRIDECSQWFTGYASSRIGSEFRVRFHMKRGILTFQVLDWALGWRKKVSGNNTIYNISRM